MWLICHRWTAAESWVKASVPLSLSEEDEMNSRASAEVNWCGVPSARSRLEERVSSRRLVVSPFLPLKTTLSLYHRPIGPTGMIPWSCNSLSAPVFLTGFPFASATHHSEQAGSGESVDRQPINRMNRPSELQVGKRASRKSPTS